MTRSDYGIVAALALVLALIIGAIAAPAFGPSAAPASSGPTPVPSAEVARYREGIVGTPSSINPLTARTPVDEALVGLLFEGLVALGPDDTLVPGLAASWTTSADGLTWTFRLRADARWHDGVRVTSHDVAWTIAILQDPGYGGARGASWGDVTVSETDEQTVAIHLSTPLGGFLEAATQPVLPAHLLEGVPVEALADHPFGRSPVGNGPFRLDSMDNGHAVLVPAGDPTGVDEPAASRSPNPLTGGDRSSPSPSKPPNLPALPGIELRFFSTPAALEEAWADGDLDGASGLSPEAAERLADSPDSRLLRYPTTTLTAVVFNLRPSQPEFRDRRIRYALLTGIDRDALIDTAFGGLAVTSDVPIPPRSWAHDRAVGDPVVHDREAAARGLADAGWVASEGTWSLPGRKDAVAFDLLSPDEATNPSTFRAAAAVVRDWERLGLDVTQRALPPGELVADHLAAGQFAAAVVDVNIGLDPDLYPLLASSQVTSQGLNVAGLQDPGLDKLLNAARAPGSDADRMAAYRTLQVTLIANQYVLPLAFRDEVVVVRDTVDGPTPRLIGSRSERFWDVLTWRLASGR